jgi:hypothetical protein
MDRRIKMERGHFLIFPLTAILFIFILKRHNQLISRLLIVLFVLLGILAVLFPGITAVVASALDRGIDYILYLYTIFSLLVLSYLISEQKKLMLMITKLTRNDAIKNARNPAGVSDKDSTAKSER